MQVQQQKTKLVLNQNQELEFQHVSEVLEMECGKIHLRGSFQDETNNIESDKKKISQLLNQSLLTCSLVMNSQTAWCQISPRKSELPVMRLKRHTKWQSWYSASSLAGGSLILVLP
jgi:hypothetical protein